MLPWMREKIFGGRQKFMNIWNRRDSVDKSDVPEKANMFVSDSNFFPSDHIKLSIISVEGAIWSIDAAPDNTIEKLISLALVHFCNPLEPAKLASNFKLVLVSEKRSLENESSVIQEGLKNFDELLVVEKREPPQKERLNEDILKSPTEDEIKAATQNVEERNILKLHAPVECTADFQSEIRKILISLVQASASILTPSPNSDEVFALIRERLESKSKSKPDAHSLRQLMDMGFSEKQASRALRHMRMNHTEALEWLLEHGDEPESSLDEAQNSSSEEVAGPSRSRGRHRSERKQSDVSPQDKESEKSVSKTVASLLESFRAFKRRDFKPNPKALQNLMDMGFEEEDIREALRITGNNQASACEWLIGERRPSLEDLDQGLDPEGPIYKAIMANPAIQLSLTSPKMLLAFLSMLESPSSANMWINDPDASPVLSQIFKTYHAEKHALQMNQYVEQQQNSPQQTS